MPSPTRRDAATSRAARPARPWSPPRRRGRRPTLRLEALEGRRLMAADRPAVASGPPAADFQVSAVKFFPGDGGDALRVAYTIAAPARPAAAGPDRPAFRAVPLTVVRSADAAADRSDRVLARVVLRGDQLTAGGHVVTIPLPADALGIDPGRPHVVATTDFGRPLRDADPGDNAAGFRKFTVGVVVDDNDSDGIRPGDSYASPWLEGMGQSLLGSGYDRVIPFSWAKTSLLPVDFSDDNAARQVADLIRRTPYQGLAGLGPDDVIDAHLIGVGRGASVAMAAAGLLETLPGTVPALQDGHVKLTLLDPVQGRGTVRNGENLARGPLGRLVGGNLDEFNSLVDDAAPTIPANVGEVELVTQKNAVQGLLGFNFAAVTGPAGTQARLGRSVDAAARAAGSSPQALGDLLAQGLHSAQGLSGLRFAGDPARVRVRYYDATGRVHGHDGLVADYQTRVAARLNRPGPLPYRQVGERQLAATPRGTLSPTDWAAYERSLLGRTLGTSLGNRVADGTRAIADALDAGTRPAAVAALDSLLADLEAQGNLASNPAAGEVAFTLVRARERMTGVVTRQVQGLDLPELGRGQGKLLSLPVVPAIAWNSLPVQPGGAGTDPADLVTATSTLPEVVDLSQSPDMPPVYNQGYVNWCTANATAAAVSYAIAQSTGLGYQPSRMFQYINTLANDQGYFAPRTIATLTDAGGEDYGMTAATEVQGFIPESQLPYPTFVTSNSLTQSQINQAFKTLLNTNPGLSNYTDGLASQVTWTGLGTETAVSVAAIQQALANGTPVVVGIACTSGFDNLAGTNQTGPPYPTVPTPTSSTAVTGYHEIVLVGYDNTQQAFIARNSWGTGVNGWGNNGYAYLPYAYYEQEIDGNAWVVSGLNFSVSATPDPSYVGNLAAVLPTDGTPSPADSGVIAINTTPLFQQGPDAVDPSAIVTAGPNFFAFNPRPGTAGGSGYLTPLLFSSPDGVHFTLTGVGAPAALGDQTTSGSGGLPFVGLPAPDSNTPNSTALSSQTYVGFYNGLVQQPTKSTPGIWTATPNAGLITVTTPAAGAGSAWIVSNQGVTTVSPGALFTLGGGLNGLSPSALAYSFTAAAANQAS